MSAVIEVYLLSRGKCSDIRILSGNEFIDFLRVIFYQVIGKNFHSLSLSFITPYHFEEYSFRGSDRWRVESEILPNDRHCNNQIQKLDPGGRFMTWNELIAHWLDSIIEHPETRFELVPLHPNSRFLNPLLKFFRRDRVDINDITIRFRSHHI